MTLWEVQLRLERTHGTFMPDNELAKALMAGGVNPAAVRDALRAANADLVSLQLVKPSGLEVETEPQVISDYLVWSWIPIFSDRAASVAVDLGCESDEFWPCQFQSNPGEPFFFHLPIRTFDIVDIDRSVFRHTLPLDPPIPMFIEHLATKGLMDHLPPCFRAEIPRARQVFSELFARQDFKLAWEQKAFSGAEFRQLSI